MLLSHDQGGVNVMPTRDDAATVQLKIRIKEPLRAAIEEDAEARGVTMNAAINDRLEQSFRAGRRSRNRRVHAPNSPPSLSSGRAQPASGIPAGPALLRPAFHPPA